MADPTDLVDEEAATASKEAVLETEVQDLTAEVKADEAAAGASTDGELAGEVKHLDEVVLPPTPEVAPAAPVDPAATPAA